jgi:mono/diheme cytochrome c family protein
VGTLLFILAWVVLFLLLFIIAVSGGPGRARERVLHSQTRRGRRSVAVIVALTFVAFGNAVPALVIAGDRDRERAGRADVNLNASERRGRDVFGRRCNQCHTLSAAKTVGKTGTNLDDLKPPKSLVLDAIRNGRARGSGRMPADLVQGRDAEDVAAYVAKVAGRQ